MKTRFKKIISLVLTAVMLLGTMTALVPMTASAAESNVAINADGSVNIPKNEDFTYQGITYRFDVREGNTESYAKILTNGSVEFKVSYGDMLWFPEIEAGDGSSIHAEVTGIKRTGGSTTMGNVYYGMAYGVKGDAETGTYTKGNAAVLRTNPRPRLTSFTREGMCWQSGSDHGNGGNSNKYYNENGTVVAANWAYIAGSSNTSDNNYKMMGVGTTLCYDVSIADGKVSALWGSYKGSFLSASYTDAGFQSNADYVSLEGAVGFLNVYAGDANYSILRLDALTVTNCTVNGQAKDSYSALNRVVLDGNTLVDVNGIDMRMDYPSDHKTSALTINADGTVTVRGDRGDLFWMPNVEVDAQSVIETSFVVDQAKATGSMSAGTVFNVDAVNGAWTTNATAMIAALRTNTRRSLGAIGYSATSDAGYKNDKLDGGPDYTLPEGATFAGTVLVNDVVNTRISQDGSKKVTAEFSVNGEAITSASYTNESYPFEGAVGFMTHWSGSNNTIGAYVYTIKEYKIKNALVDGQRKDFDLVAELKAYMMNKVSAYAMQSSLSLDGVIGLNVKVDANYFTTGNETVVVKNEADETVASVKIAEAVVRNANGYNVIVSVPVNAKEMGDIFTVSVKNGDEVLKTTKISVKEYAELLLDNEDYAEWHDLIGAMLNYGAAAQKVLNYKTNALVADIENLNTDMSELETIQVVGDSSVLTAFYTTLTIEADTALNLYFKATEALSAVVEGETVPMTETEDGYFRLTIADISAEQLSKDFVISMNDGAFTVTISACRWAKNVVESNQTDDMKSLAKALVGYATESQILLENDSSIPFSNGTQSYYSISYEASASEYFKGLIGSFVQNMKRESVNVPVTNEVTDGKNVMLSISENVEGWKITVDSNKNIIIRGNNELMLAVGFNVFSGEMLEKNTNGDFWIIDSQTRFDCADEYARDGWSLAVPAYEGGTLASDRYDAGTGIDKDDPLVANLERAYMMCVSGTTRNEFTAYENKLVNCGYVLDSQSTLLDANGTTQNPYRLYRKGYNLLYVYYNESKKEARIIEDQTSVVESEFEYSFAADANTATEIYMYGMKYSSTGEATSDATNCGAFYIIKQADNSVILIDGGAGLQSTAAAKAGLWSFLREITGTDDNEKVTVACWIISHPHEDHFMLAYDVLKEHRTQIDLQRVMFNFPNPVVTGENVYEFRGNIDNYFPNVRFLKCHTGQSIHLGSIDIDILMTHEDLVNASTGESTLNDNGRGGNSMTSLMMFTLPDGTKFLSLGDFEEEQQDPLFEYLDESVLKCDIVTVAHHGYNEVEATYSAAQAKYALWSNHTSDGFDKGFYGIGASWQYTRAQNIIGWLKSANNNIQPNIYYAGVHTVKLTCVNGTITATTTTPVY